MYRDLEDALCKVCGAYPCMCNLPHSKKIIEARDKNWIAWIERFIFELDGSIIIAKTTWAERKKEVSHDIN